MGLHSCVWRGPWWHKTRCMGLKWHMSFSVPVIKTTPNHIPLKYRRHISDLLFFLQSNRIRFVYLYPPNPHTHLSLYIFIHMYITLQNLQNFQWHRMHCMGLSTAVAGDRFPSKARLKMACPSGGAQRHTCENYKGAMEGDINSRPFLSPLDRARD